MGAGTGNVADVMGEKAVAGLGFGRYSDTLRAQTVLCKAFGRRNGVVPRTADPGQTSAVAAETAPGRGDASAAPPEWPSNRRVSSGQGNRASEVAWPPILSAAEAVG